ncbi:MAG: DUF115 domain-containing protein [Bdellovibrionales bacterium]|nr:DUF115 domain-containing protein [Bdellovibrionales bacterium]
MTDSTTQQHRQSTNAPFLDQIQKDTSMSSNEEELQKIKKYHEKYIDELEKQINTLHKTYAQNQEILKIERDKARYEVRRIKRTTAYRIGFFVVLVIKKIIFVSKKFLAAIKAKLSKKTFEIEEPVEVKALSKKDHAKRLKRQVEYLQSNACRNIMKLQNIHLGKRAFVIGNGPSLKNQDLSKLENEIVFVTNWFANHQDFEKIKPTYYTVASHEVFGGWNKTPDFDPNFYKLLNTKTKNTKKFFSYTFKPYIESNKMFEGHDIEYLLFERPKQLIDQLDQPNADLTKHMDDGYTVIATFCLPLARWMGIKEIILLGCDCDYGIKKESDKKSYFYDAKLHTTSVSKFENLQRIWADGGPVFQSYEKIRNDYSMAGVTIRNATGGGRLEVFEKVAYEDLFTS